MIDAALALEPQARAAAQLLLNAVWQGVLLTAGMAVLLRWTRGTSPATRYLLWCATLAAVVTLPLVTALTGPGPAASPAHTVSVGGVVAAGRSEGWTLHLPSGPWMTLLLGIGAVVALARMVGVARGVRSVRKLKREASPLPAPYPALLGPALAAVRVGRSVELKASHGIVTPVAVGLLHPAVLLPAGLLGELSEEEVVQVTVHELAHLRRRDDWSNLVQRLIEAVFFFHPAVRWIGPRLELERELACDFFVVKTLTGRRAYARCLTRLAGLAVASRSAALTPGAAPGPGQLTRRIHALLSPERPSGAWRCGASSLVLGTLPFAAVLALAGTPLRIALATAPGLRVAAPAPPTGPSVRVHVAAHGPGDVRQASVAGTRDPGRSERSRGRTNDAPALENGGRGDVALPSLRPVEEQPEHPAPPRLAMGAREPASGPAPEAARPQGESPRFALQVTVHPVQAEGPLYALSRSPGAVLPRAARPGIRLRILGGAARRSPYGALEGVY
jgi:beta-lactamase regulating signal transducer with metallopeptidase domain